jgi:uncharacterized protein (TIGR03435 family)
MSTLLMTAYDVKSFQISGPAWIDTETFDISAALPPETTQEQCRAMLRNLFAERFKITLHRETKQLQMYSLTVAKGGPKMKASAEIPDPKDDAEPALPRSRPKIGPDGFMVLEEMPAWAPISIITMPGRAHMMGRQKTMENLADRLTVSMSRPGIDATALKGKYDFAITYAPDSVNGAAAPDVDALPDIFAAIQSQLGLRLEPKKGPVEMIVIDRIEKTPTEN